MKRNQFGQASLPSSFLSKSRSSSGRIEAKPSKRPVSLSDFLDQKLRKSNGRSIQEKPSSFSSVVGSGKKDLGNKEDEAGSRPILDGAIFRRLNRSAMEDCGDRVGEGRDCREDGRDSRKRKNPFGVPSGHDERSNAPKYLVVLGDDPKPKPKIKERKLVDHNDKPLYNHYANGRGWWDGDSEGIDGEEVGCKDVWEGMGSTTLGGLEWH